MPVLLPRWKKKKSSVLWKSCLRVLSQIQGGIRNTAVERLWTLVPEKLETWDRPGSLPQPSLPLGMPEKLRQAVSRRSKRAGEIHQREREAVTGCGRKGDQGKGGLCSTIWERLNTPLLPLPAGQPWADPGRPLCGTKSRVCPVLWP